MKNLGLSIRRFRRFARARHAVARSLVSLAVIPLPLISAITRLGLDCHLDSDHDRKRAFISSKLSAD